MTTALNHATSSTPLSGCKRLCARGRAGTRIGRPAGAPVGASDTPTSPGECERQRGFERHARTSSLASAELQWPTRPRPAETGSRRPQRVTPAEGTRSRGVRGRAPLSPAPRRGTALVLSADPGVACRHGNLSRLWCRAARAVVVVRRVSGADGGRGAAERHYRRVRPHRVGARPQRAPRPRVRALGGAALV
jgi:hypothetical protein